MNCQPVSRESLDDLHRLRERVIGRGDECLGLVLSGVELYASLGREFELLEIMKRFADEMKDPVDNTPTADELDRLYRREDTRDT